MHRRLIGKATLRRNQSFWEYGSSRAEPRDPATPKEFGARDDETFSLKTLIPFIDWSPFFHTWELRGRYPAILDDATFGKQARELFDDAQKLLTKVVEERLVQARGVIGFWPANAVGDDVEVFTDDSRSSRLTTLHFLRQQMRKPSGQFNLCLADYVAPKTQLDGGLRPPLQDLLEALLLLLASARTKLRQNL